MKLIVFSLTLFLISTNLFSQNKDTTKYKYCFSINIESIFVGDFKISFTNKLNNNNYFETMLSYNFPNDGFVGINNQFSGLRLEDPYNYYGRVQIRAGLRHYLTRKFYIGSMILYNNGKFNKRTVVYYSNSDYYTSSRQKNDIELLVKWGWTFKTNNFIKDLYFGCGYRYKLLNDKVYAAENALYPPTGLTYPYQKNETSSVITFHLGFQIGFCR